MPSQSKLEIIVNAKDNASGVLARIGGGLSSLGGIAASVAIGGLAAIAGGLAAIGTVGLDFNSQIEQVTARLNAFTKDGAETARILEQIKVEAAKTPFEFQEMANATANLMSSARQANIPLMDLIKTSEILAASNPAQGLEGAAFSLKEALSGDFVSIVERFNLPRQRLKELKEEGVPAMEAISIAMKEMGLDSSLVSNMAETAAGRWSTLKDTFINMAGVITQPIFDTFSAGLGQLNAWFTENEGLITGYAEKVAVGVQQIIDIITPLASGETQLALQNFQGALLRIGFSPEQVGSISEGITAIIADAERIGTSFGKIFGAENVSGIDAVVAAFDNIAAAVEIIAGSVEAVERVFNAVKGSVAGQVAGAVGSAIQITPSEVASNFNTAQTALRPEGFQAAPQGGFGGQFGGQIDLTALGQMIVDAFKTAPPPIVNVSTTLNGKEIAQDVSATLGTQALTLSRQGGFNPR